MMKTRPIYLGLGLAGTGVILAACGESASGPADGELSACVEIPDGYYLFEDGKLSPASDDMEIALPEEPAPRQEQVAAPQETDNAIAGSEQFDWLMGQTIGPVLVLTGRAPDETARAEAVASATDRAAGRPGRPAHYIVNGISLNGATPAGSRLTALQASPDRDACQTVAEEVMRGRRLSYGGNEDTVSESSHATLNAVAGLAMICSDYTLEIGVHTDARGAESYNQSRSERRAEAIRTYLTGQGVAESGIKATGYGETQPIDPSQTSEAYALNNRVELTFAADSD